MCCMLMFSVCLGSIFKVGSLSRTGPYLPVYARAVTTLPCLNDRDEIDEVGRVGGLGGLGDQSCFSPSHATASLGQEKG